MQQSDRKPTPTLGWKLDVIVSDIGMPEEDGYTMIEKIRKLEPELGGDTPAIALTGYVRVEERMRALEAATTCLCQNLSSRMSWPPIIASLAGRMGKGKTA